MEIRKKIKNKAVVFSLDAAIAVTVIIIILINSQYFFSVASKESLSQLQPVRLGTDILAMLDYSGELQYAILSDPIESESTTILTIDTSTYLTGLNYTPKNYVMRVAVSDMVETTCESQWPPEKCELVPGDPLVLDTKDIKSPGRYYLQMAFDSVPSGVTVTNVDTTESSSDPFSYDPNPRVYSSDPTDMVYIMPFAYHFNGDPNTLSFSTTNPGITLKWFRVLGDESYAKYAISDNSKWGALDDIPEDRFVGTGERYIAVSGEGAKEDQFEGFHFTRFWVWLNN